MNEDNSVAGGANRGTPSELAQAERGEDALGDDLRQDPQRKLVLKLAVAVLAASIVAFVALNFGAILDTLAGFGYSPSEEMSSIKSSLDLTGDADRIFNASHPVLDSKDDFNKACDSHEEKTAVLGCYADRVIHIYSVDAEELKGIKESTTAHELLHAVWSRLGDSEKDRLKSKLEEAYKTSETLKTELENYSEKDRLDELHSRVGTEIKDLESDLETHYAKYFKDQDKIVSYYSSYIEPFETLKKQIEELSKTLETLKKKIDEGTKNYKERAEKLNQEITEFNNCAGTLNCFTSRGVFNSRRSELSAEQSAVNDLYAELDANIKEYNSKVGEYNNNILKNQDLENLINSNKEVKL